MREPVQSARAAACVRMAYRNGSRQKLLLIKYLNGTQKRKKKTRILPLALTHQRHSARAHQRTRSMRKFVYPEDAFAVATAQALPSADDDDVIIVEEEEAAAGVAEPAPTAAARWVDPDAKPPQGSQELRNNWEQNAARAFGVFNRNPTRAPARSAHQSPLPEHAEHAELDGDGGHPDINHRRITPASHDLTAHDWGRSGGGADDYAKRARTRVLPRAANPERGAGIPMARR